MNVGGRPKTNLLSQYVILVVGFGADQVVCIYLTISNFVMLPLMPVSSPSKIGMTIYNSIFFGRLKEEGIIILTRYKHPARTG